MAITNKKTLEKMKKKNLKSVRVGKDGKVTNANKKASKKGLWDWLKGDKFKKKAPASNVDSGRGGKDSARQKIYDKKSMFAKKAATRDTAKTKISDRSFKSTFDAAEKAGKSTFTYGGRDFMTNKGKGENRDKKKTEIAPKGSIKKKSSLDADTRKSYEKRVAWMKKRKAAGKNFSAKNLAELEAKLK